MNVVVEGRQHVIAHMHTNVDSRGFMLLQHEEQLKTFGAYKSANPDWDVQSCSKGQMKNVFKAFDRGNLSYARVETLDEKILIMPHTSRRTQIRMMELHQTRCLDAWVASTKISLVLQANQGYIQEMVIRRRIPGRWTKMCLKSLPVFIPMVSILCVRVKMKRWSQLRKILHNWSTAMTRHAPVLAFFRKVQRLKYLCKICLFERKTLRLSRPLLIIWALTFRKKIAGECSY
jgi:hypothetical protein